MNGINFNHLYYFWTVAEHGGITKAAEVLYLTPQTISAQIHALEERIGKKLFEKQGRKLKLTSEGHVTKSYADEIFSKASEWLDTLAQDKKHISMECRVGVTDGMPKSLVTKWLSPILQLNADVQLDCQDGNLDELLEQMENHQLDLILTDLPLATHAAQNVMIKLLGRSGIGMFGCEFDLAKGDVDFPACVNGQRIVMPGKNSALSHRIEQWQNQHNLKLHKTVYANDIALMKSLGRDGFGMYAAPMIVKDEIILQYQATFLGQMDGVEQEYYLITPKRSISHPITSAIVASATELNQ
jgi:LysR family transcriptional activator of nhaA